MRGRLGEFDGRMKLVALIAFATTIYFNIGKAVWWPGGWTFNLYVAVADFVMLVAAGFIIARWFMPRSAS
jgi:predicted heme/steroid binding protein